MASADYMFYEYKYLIFNLVFPTSVFYGRNFFLTVSFPDHCLHLPFKTRHD